MPLANPYDTRRAETPMTISLAVIKHNVYREEVNFRNVEYRANGMGNSEVYFTAKMNKSEDWIVRLQDISDNEIESFKNLDGKIRNTKNGRTFTINAGNTNSLDTDNDATKAIKIHLTNKADKKDPDEISFWHRR